jgi:oligopeptidase B
MSTEQPATAGPAEPGARRPPLARRAPVETWLHGERRVDEYAWLRGREDPAVRAYLDAENAYADAVLAPTRPLQAKLYDEMLARIQETDESVPYRKGRYFYYSRTEEGRQYPVYCRERDEPDARTETTLDLNALAAGRPFLALGAFTVSDDASSLGYSLDETGYRQYTLFVKDLATGAVVETVAERVGSAAWAADNRTLFYTVEEERTKRQYRLFRHAVGTAAHELVYEEADPAFNVYVYRTRSGAYLVLGSASLTTSEARVLPAADPSGEWLVVAPRIQEQEYDLDHAGGFFFIRTSDRGRNFRLVKAPVASPARPNWTELLPHRPEVMIEGVDCFRDHLVVGEREGGLPQLLVLDLRDGRRHRITFPDAAYTVSPDTNLEFDTSLFRYAYQSLVRPPSVFDYDMTTRERRLLKEQPVLGGYDRTRYETERVIVAAPDGAGVPVSLVYRKGMERDGSAPLHLYGYGAYGYPLPAGFSSHRISLLDRGVVVAIAHVRGGGELGKAWHDAGRLLCKRNSFSDFIAVADWLVATGYGNRDRLTIEGGSAGGLLVGAVINERPALARAALLLVPFVDVINTMLDESLPLTVGEFEEWGDPRRKAFYDYMASYCPYTNLGRKAYPAMLVKTSFNDSQVMYWEPAKYVARLRAVKTDTNPLLLKVNMDAGHGGASGRYDYLREVALDYAFLLTQMGLG